MIIIVNIIYKKYETFIKMWHHDNISIQVFQRTDVLTLQTTLSTSSPCIVPIRSFPCMSKYKTAIWGVLWKLINLL